MACVAGTAGAPTRPAAARQNLAPAGRADQIRSVPRYIRPDFARESAALAAGARIIAGVDEVGRGPLAGPVLAAAVILDPARIPSGLDDSKKLAPAVREALFGAILAHSQVSIGLADVAEIDRDNIRIASLRAMRRAVLGLAKRPCVALIDGRDRPDLDCAAEPIVSGDALSLSIAAASIVAKVARDRLMARLALRFPGYGFERHKGYGTAEHHDALRRLGPCPIHRRSFAPVSVLLDPP